MLGSVSFLNTVCIRLADNLFKQLKRVNRKRKVPLFAILFCITIQFCEYTPQLSYRSKNLVCDFSLVIVLVALGIYIRFPVLIFTRRILPGAETVFFALTSVGTSE
jgi:uncharacterized membrane protein YadS